MRIIFLCLLFTAVLSSCSNPVNSEIISENGLYSLDIPKSYKKTTEISNASLQYIDPDREILVIVKEDQKDAIIKLIADEELEDIISEDINGYSMMVLTILKPELNPTTTPPFQDVVINGLKARKTTLKGSFDGVDIHYELGIIEGKNRFYKIMIRALAKNHEKYEAEMMAIIDSFKETGGSIAK